MGVDIGSATSKCIIINEAAEIVAQSVIAAGTGTRGPDRAVEAALGAAGAGIEQISKVVATGYGRYTYETADDSASELSCHAGGAVWIMPGIRTVIDIGGQDVKALSISVEGRLENFVMNDKCAAGTGRFLEVMARVLEIDIDKLAEYDDRADGIVSVSSTCVVFAESEVISHLANKANVPNLIAGIHQSAAARAASLMKRIGIKEPILMTGGVANNAGVVRALERSLGVPIQTSPYSQVAGALGAALIALERKTKE